MSHTVQYTAYMHVGCYENTQNACHCVTMKYRKKLTGIIRLDHKAIWATIKTVLRLGVEGHPD